MPADLARFLTSSSNDPGSRRFTDASFGFISNRMGTITDRSYCDRSAFSTNASASASLVRRGSLFSGFFICPSLFLVHGTRTDRSNKSVAAPVSECERYEDVPALCRCADCQESCFMRRVLRIRRNQHHAAEQFFDLGNRNPVLPAVGSVALIPVETRNIHVSLTLPMYRQLSTQKQRRVRLPAWYLCKGEDRAVRAC